MTDQPLACGYQLSNGDICGLNANHTGNHRDGSPMNSPAPGPSNEDDGSAVLTVELSQSQADRLLKGATLEGDLTTDVGPATLEAMGSLVNDGEPMIYQVRVVGAVTDDQDKAVGGSDVCITCSAHCTEIECLLEEIKQLTDALDLQRQVLDHREIKMMEGMAMAHGCQYSDEFGALAKKAKVARTEGIPPEGNSHGN